MKKIVNALARAVSRLQLIFCRIYVAVDITPTEIRVLSVRRNNVEKWETAPLREGLIKDGVIIDPQELSLVLENLFTSLSLPRNRVICTITGLPFSYRTIAIPDTRTAVTQETVERAARKEMSITEPDMHIFWKSIERQPEKNETNCFVVAVPKLAIRPLTEALTKSRIKLYEMDIKPLALARLASAQNAMIISLEPKYVDIVIVADGLVKTLYSFPLVITTGDRDRIVAEVINGLYKTMKSYSHDYPGTPLPAETPLFISGGFITDNEILNNFKSAFGHQVASFESPVTLLPDLPPALCAASLGLVLKKSPLNSKIAAARAAHYKDININLLSGLIQRGIHINKKRAAPLFSIILIVILICFAYVLRHEAIIRSQALNIENSAAAVRLLVLQKENKDYLSAQKAVSESVLKLQVELKERTAAQQYISNAQVDCARDINMVIDALPQNADYRTITISRNSIQISGQAQNALNVMDMADWLEGGNNVAAVQVVSIQPAPDAVTFSLVIRKN